MENSTLQQTNNSEERKIQKIVLPGQTPEGQHILSVLIKRSYNIISDKRCIRAEIDQKIFAGDVYFGDPMNSTIQFESDFAPYKIATDVVLNGKAYAPGGIPIESMIASLIVGQSRKDILVIGDRVAMYQRWRDPEFKDPIPFITMDIRYENAYGGVDIYSNPAVPFIYPRNILGKGFVINKSKKTVDNLALPNIEDRNDLLTPARLCVENTMNWDRQPMPQGFGWFSKIWLPRASFAGVMPADRALEQELRKAYAMAVPPEQKNAFNQTNLPDMDFRFFNGASQGLTFPFMSGEESITLINLSPDKEIKFQLPGERPHIGLDIGMGVQEPEVFLHTVMIRAEERQVDLVWRGAVPYPGRDWLPEMKKMDVFIN
ncbi:MAG: hypothetical protein QG641_2818 [Candidatus Poribacteria bacterium]|nr:hypothetical protein [Candidatus Poribacteria bacterium]